MMTSDASRPTTKLKLNRVKVTRIHFGIPPYFIINWSRMIWRWKTIALLLTSFF